MVRGNRFSVDASDDPSVIVSMAGASGVLAGAAMIWPIELEAWSIAATYAPLTLATVGPPLPVVPLLTLPPPAPLRFHHASASLPAVLERIQAGTGAGPIAGLGGGTFIVSLQITYYGLVVVVKLFKA